MQLEDYFEFVGPQDIRIKGHRIGIESVLYPYVYRQQSAEEIAATFDTLSLPEVHATILYYLCNRDKLDGYLAEWVEHAHLGRQESERLHADWYCRLRSLKKEHGVPAPTGA